MEKYSVLMSIYKNVKPEELEISINSMLQQTYIPDQFVIVYDGPVDDTVNALVEKYCYLNPDIFTILSIKENHGLAYSLNMGIKQCRNEFVARMDSDDYSLPERCEKQIAFMEANPEYVVVGTCTKNFIGCPNNIIDYIKKRPLTYEEICQDIKRNCPFCHPSVMLRKSVITAEGGYDNELKRSQDYDLFARLIWRGYKLINLPDVLFLFRADEGFSSRTKSKESCKCRIEIQKRLLKRKQCSLWDYLYVRFAMFLTRILPNSVFKKIYKFVKGQK